MDQPGLDEWQGRARHMKFEDRAFIDGSYCDAFAGGVFICYSGIDGEPLTEVADCGQEEVARSVTSARRAFEAGVWSRISPRKRKAVLLRWAGLIREHASTIALLETLDTGKPIAMSMGGDLPGAAYCIEWFAEAIDKVGGEVPSSEPEVVGLVTREPVGVVAAIVPWNFPLLMAAWKLAPALAAGNSVILKPSEKSPLSAIFVAQLAHEAGIPSGVFNVLPGQGECGRLLALHEDVDCVTFTGSTAVGKLIAQYAGQSNLKRVWLELGGKSPHIICSDCDDVTRAANSAADAIFYNAGQMCSAGSRLLVHRSLKEEVIATLKAATERFRPGHPLDPDTTMGAIVDRQQYDKVMKVIDLGRAQSDVCTLLAGGEAVTPFNAEGGCYIEPTIFDVQSNDCVLAQEEIFGPVLSVLTFDTIDEAIHMANDTRYGLGAGIWSASMTNAHHMARRLKSGFVWINCYEEGNDMNFPFGGVKQSGNGRDRSLHALDKYTELKSTLIRL